MKRRILIMDDEESIVFPVRRYFEREGFTVDWAQELEEAEALLAHFSYAVLIADLRLSSVHGAEGLEILSHVRNHVPDTKTILLTAYGTPSVIEEAYRRGASTVIQKPQVLAELMRVVQELLEATP